VLTTDDLRHLAAHAKALVDLMPDPKSRQVMLEIAERYEALAAEAESWGKELPGEDATDQD
jgi:hypothetical protein